MTMLDLMIPRDLALEAGGAQVSHS